MTDSTTTEILELGRRWAEAEQCADVETLDALAVATSRWSGYWASF